MITFTLSQIANDWKQTMADQQARLPNKMLFLAK